jgi:xanthine dehydrogenase accessory factor
MIDWLDMLAQRLARKGPVVRVVVAATRGSAPRERGACMLVGEAQVDGTIGGGHLELKAIEIARGMLHKPGGGPTRLDRFALGATLGQCCGGAVELWFERFSDEDRDFLAQALRARENNRDAVLITHLQPSDSAPRRMITDAAPPGQALARMLVERLEPALAPLWLFGAGHVGNALIRVLAGLAFRVIWVDSRDGVFPASLPENVCVLHSDAPEGEVSAAPAGAFYLVLTHSHDLDYEIVRSILRRNDFAWAGLIGSATKAKRFAQRLARQGVPAARIARLVSPIGIAGISSKLPGAIAIAVAAQLQQELEAYAMRADDAAAQPGTGG